MLLRLVPPLLKDILDEVQLQPQPLVTLLQVLGQTARVVDKALAAVVLTLVPASLAHADRVVLEVFVPGHPVDVLNMVKQEGVDLVGSQFVRFMSGLKIQSYVVKMETATG